MKGTMLSTSLSWFQGMGRLLAQGPIKVPDGLPHPVKGLIRYQWQWPSWFSMLVGALVLALIAWVSWRLWRRRQNARRSQRGPAEDPVLALQKQLQALSPPLPFEGKRQAEYFFHLSMLFRQLVELTCRFPATDLTLKELKLPLRSHLPLPYEDVEAVLAFCERAELIKFADAPTSLEEAEQCHGKVKKWSAHLIRKVQSPTYANEAGALAHS